MYRMGMCCMLIDEDNTLVNRSKCIKMAIVHDLAESLVGDITPHDGPFSFCRSTANAKVILTWPYACRRRRRGQTPHGEGALLTFLVWCCSDKSADVVISADCRRHWSIYAKHWASRRPLRRSASCGASTRPAAPRRPRSSRWVAFRCGHSIYLSGCVMLTEHCIHVATQDFDKFEMILQADEYERGACDRLPMLVVRFSTNNPHFPTCRPEHPAGRFFPQHAGQVPHAARAVVGAGAHGPARRASPVCERPAEGGGVGRSSGMLQP